MSRRIIVVDERRCTGCGLCMPDCPAGSLEVEDGRSHLVDERLCDGCGACVGACPKEAIEVVECEARPFDQVRLMERVVARGGGAVRFYLEHLRARGDAGLLRQTIGFLEENGIPVPAERDPSGGAASADL